MTGMDLNPRFARIAPNTMVFSDIGPDMRWVGNENGIVGNNQLESAGHCGI